MERFIPVRQGIDIGSGFNVLSGEVRGVAVGGQIDVGTFSGQEADLTRDLRKGWRAATIRTLLSSNDAGASPGEPSFFSAECKGFSASIGDIHFRATLLQLPTEEQDPRGVSYVPR